MRGTQHLILLFRCGSCRNPRYLRFLALLRRDRVPCLLLLGRRPLVPCLVQCRPSRQDRPTDWRSFQVPSSPSLPENPSTWPTQQRTVLCSSIQFHPSIPSPAPSTHTRCFPFCLPQTVRTAQELLCILSAPWAPLKVVTLTASLQAQPAPDLTESFRTKNHRPSSLESPRSPATGWTSCNDLGSPIAIHCNIRGHFPRLPQSVPSNRFGPGPPNASPLPPHLTLTDLCTSRQQPSPQTSSPSQVAPHGFLGKPTIRRALENIFSCIRSA